MEENKRTEDSLAEEFRRLGKNLTEVLHTAWNRPGRKRLREEITSSLSELGSLLKEEAKYMSESPAGQRLKAEAEDLRQRVRSGEVEAKARQEMLSALRIANEQLRKAIDYIEEADDRQRREGETDRPRGAPEDDKETTPMKDAGRREAHPDDVEADLDQGSDRQEVHPDDVES